MADEPVWSPGERTWIPALLRLAGTLASILVGTQMDKDNRQGNK
jgi:hypothetical protein